MSHSTGSGEQKIWRYLLIGLLVVHVLVQLVFGIQLFSAPPNANGSVGIEATGTSQLNDLLVLWTTMAQSFLIAVGILGIFWTLAGKKQGAIIGLVMGGFFMVLGLGLLNFANRNGLPVTGSIFDVGRGALTVLFALLTLRELRK